MKKFLLASILFFPLLLAGCNQPYLIKKELVVVPIPPKLYEGCPVLKKYTHNWRKLRDPHVAAVIVELYKNNVKCHNAIEAIRRFEQNAKKRVERANYKN